MLRKIRFVDSKSQQHVKASPGAIPRREPVQRFLYIFFSHLVYYEVTFKVEVLCFINNVALSRSRFSPPDFFPHLLHSFWDQYSSCNIFLFVPFSSISSISGGGSSVRRKILVISLLNSCRELEMKYLVRTLVSFLFQGSAILISNQKVKQFKTKTRSEDVSINSMVLLPTSHTRSHFLYCSNC